MSMNANAAPSPSKAGKKALIATPVAPVKRPAPLTPAQSAAIRIMVKQLLKGVLQPRGEHVALVPTYAVPADDAEADAIDDVCEAMGASVPEVVANPPE
ncbi:hypothetical protein AMAG_19640 [Allomyces macrogynus ATCC 38327]|uniref:Uncharacterized protein n=1 Tax=Allomyces macrogynus (strain ATCC 38327) TaxID=578462 RepID=A0A0L0SZ64_ALLM3|nr:hypothetical protein AMAG_19640 [Allomyces macrogynus ATCC 38327]|eukprot:KNE67599.1 hypothetical protein AMAG_19640 [Allomyces macrogynus ATCC 38327]